MATKAAHKRLAKEYVSITASPIPYIVARPLESNILEWHYVITGPEDSPYAGGQFHGVITFPSDYPFKPPSIKMLTPNGRFQTNFRLCLTMSDYHPQSWNPAWSVSTILTGLLSFMLEDTSTTGSISTSTAQKRALVKQSWEWNRRNPKFCLVFPDLCCKEVLPSSSTSSDSLKRRRARGENKDASLGHEHGDNQKEASAGRSVLTVGRIGSLVAAFLFILVVSRVVDRIKNHM
ncbi:MAG: hypothetical protein SGCHY_001017 [Lobulomycetales sp.]